MNFTDLSDCELHLMKCLWDEGTPLSVTSLLERIEANYGKIYKETTVYTFLKRMRDKGYVTSYKKGTSYFSPLITEEEYLNDYSRKMAEFLGKGSSRTFLSAFFKHQNYTDEEWEDIRSLRDELE